MTQTMRAMVVNEPGSPDVLQPVQLPVPEPGAGRVRLRVAFVGMNPVDALVRRERLDWMPVRYPFVPGLEHTGVVDRVGPDVDPSWLGQRVLSRVSFGGYADYSIAAAGTLLRVPPELSLLEGCVYRGCSYTAWHALFKVAQLASGDRLLVHSAAGAVGIMALQMAASVGATAVGLLGNVDKIDWVRSFHEGPIISYLDESWVSHALQASGGGGYDVIIDGNAGPTAERNFDLVARLGRIVYLGAMSGSPAPPVPVARLIDKSCLIAGMTLRQIEEPPGSAADREILGAIVAKRWKLPISEVVPLAHAADLHRRLEARQLKGRAVVEVGGEKVTG
ncbi:MAG: zinc-binding alcohol dehydrogenase family protein [Steroidobacteraceae bacterium]